MTQLQDHVTLSGSRPTTTSTSPSEGRRSDRRRRRGGARERRRGPGRVRGAAHRPAQAQVVFLRDQQGLTDDDQRAFARQFGPLTKPHPTVSGRRRGDPADRLRAAEGQLLAHRRDVRRPGARDQRAARAGAAALWRHHGLGEHRGRLRPAPPRAEGAGRQPPGGAHQPVRLRRRPGDGRRRRRQGAGLPGPVQAHGVRDRAPGRPHPPGDGRADAAARPLRQVVHRTVLG